MTPKKVIQVAEKEIGYTESPANSNKTKYGAAYGLNGAPWCVMFLWWCFREAGMSSLFFGGKKTASCGEYRGYARRVGEWVTDNYKVGDLPIFDFPGTAYETDHIGIIVEIPNDDEIITIEGNTSVTGSQSNGGMVMKKTRKLSSVIGAIRPKYIEEEEEEDMTGQEIYEKLNAYLKTLPAPEWAREELQEAVEAGITDGTRPMQLVPRYQAAIMALRASKQ